MKKRGFGGRERKEKENKRWKCDVRLNKDENEMLDQLSEANGVSRSDVMRRSLKDYYKFNTGIEEDA